MTWAELTELARRLYNEFGINMYDEDGNVKFDEVNKLVSVVLNAKKEG